MTNPYQTTSGNTDQRRPRKWMLAALAGLMIAIAYFGYAGLWIAKRHQAFMWFKQRHCGPVMMHPGTAPPALRPLGESGYESIAVAVDTERAWSTDDLSVREEVARLFPEADVYPITLAELDRMYPAGSGATGK